MANRERGPSLPTSPYNNRDGGRERQPLSLPLYCNSCLLLSSADGQMNFSLKNIPFPSEAEFILSLTDKMIDFIQKIRWKTLSYYRDEKQRKKFQLKYQILDKFEEDLFKQVKENQILFY